MRDYLEITEYLKKKIAVSKAPKVQKRMANSLVLFKLLSHIEPFAAASQLRQIYSYTSNVVVPQTLNLQQRNSLKRSVHKNGQNQKVDNNDKIWGVGKKMVERQLTANPKELNPKNRERWKTTPIVPLNLKRRKNYSTNILLEPRIKRGESTIRRSGESLRKRSPNTNYTHTPYCWAND